MGLNTVLWRKKPDLGHKRLPQINKQSSDFDEIWHTNADLERDYGRMTKYKKNLKILYGGRRLYKSLFGHNSTADCPTSVKFCAGKQNGMTTEVE